MNQIESAIRVRGLAKRFGDKVVIEGFDIEVPRGAIFGFLGPNGSGKTTSIRMICGLLRPDSGHGTCLGYDIRDSTAIKREVGYMTQRFSLWEDLTIRENLEFVARMYGMADRREAVTAILKEIGLEPRKDQLAGTLSGGWKQRLALAACLLHDPKLLLLDEPTAGMSRADTVRTIELLQRIGARITKVIIEHDMQVVFSLASRISVLAQGAVIAERVRGSSSTKRTSRGPKSAIRSTSGLWPTGT